MKLIKTLRFLASRSRVLVLVVSVCSTNVCRTFAQDQPHGAEPIQVKTDEILVPVLVLDQKRIDAIHRMDMSSYLNQVNAPNSHLLLDLAVMGLTAEDFHIFEDGKEQKIRRMTTEPGWNLKPPVGPGYESPGSPLDRADSARKFFLNYIEMPHWPTYHISYEPPPSPNGSCHTVRVRIDRPNSYVDARSEYCNTTHAVYDTLNGTPLGNRLAADLDAENRGSIRLMATTFGLFHGHAAAYTDILLNASRQSRPEDCNKLPEVGFFGMIYSSDGKLAARFSGRAMGGDLFQSTFPLLAPTSSPLFGPCFLTATDVFETQLDLPPGEYKLHAVIREGKNFGRTEIPIHVENFNGMQFAISDIALGKNYRQVTAGSQPDSDPLWNDQQFSLVSQGFELLPTADTRFKTGQMLHFYLEVFYALQSVPPPGKIEVHMRVLDAETGKVVKELLPEDTAPYSKPGDPVIPVGGGIDVANLPTGSYQVQAQATDSTGKTTAWNSVAFSIQ